MPEIRCACHSHDAYECARLRYPSEGNFGDEDQTETCECPCHDHDEDDDA